MECSLGLSDRDASMSRRNFGDSHIYILSLIVGLSVGCVELPAPLKADFNDTSVALDAMTEPLDRDLETDILQTVDAFIPMDTGEFPDGQLIMDIGVVDDVQVNPDVYLSECGNGLIDPGEECDTSGASETCSETCLTIAAVMVALIQVKRAMTAMMTRMMAVSTTVRSIFRTTI